MNLTKNNKVILAKGNQGSAGSAVNSDAIDMQGYDGVVFVGVIETVGSGNFAKIQQSDQSGTGFSDLKGTKVAPGDDGDSFMIDINRPRKRYVRCVVDRSDTNTATGDIYAILYKASKAPVSHGSTIDSEVHVSPAEGTA